MGTRRFVFNSRRLRATTARPNAGGPEKTPDPFFRPKIKDLIANLAGGVLSAGCHWNVMRSVRLSVTAFAFRGSFPRFALPEFKTL